MKKYIEIVAFDTSYMYTYIIIFFAIEPNFKWFEKVKCFKLLWSNLLNCQHKNKFLNIKAMVINRHIQSPNYIVSTFLFLQISFYTARLPTHFPSSIFWRKKTSFFYILPFPDTLFFLDDFE